MIFSVSIISLFLKENTENFPFVGKWEIFFEKLKNLESERNTWLVGALLEFREGTNGPEKKKKKSEKIICIKKIKKGNHLLDFFHKLLLLVLL